MTIIFTAMITTGGNKGLYYYGARYYDPKVSVWLSVDPLAHEYPGLSPYNFVANNPLIFIDPDGMSIWTTQGGWAIISDGLRGMFGDATPFQRNSETGLVELNKGFDAASLTGAKKEVYDRYKSLIEDKDFSAPVYDVGQKETFIDSRGQFQNLQNDDGSFNIGRTVYDEFMDEANGVAEKNAYVYLARNPMRKDKRKVGESPLNPMGFIRDYERSSYFPIDDRGFASLHEIIGHTYLYSQGIMNIAPDNLNNKLTEKLEKGLRNVYRRTNGSIIRGEVKKH
jgi:RHS repeat-associated protein